ncbi:hypothetical protein, partial [Vibrio parahaemolyticus]|uniref:hypothetical protein n=1 Tax=Vibrio parahaemolyticus TaxID=670 RepID=UPI0005B2F90F
TQNVVDKKSCFVVPKKKVKKIFKKREKHITIFFKGWLCFLKKEKKTTKKTKNPVFFRAGLKKGGGGGGDPTPPPGGGGGGEFTKGGRPRRASPRGGERGAGG